MQETADRLLVGDRHQPRALRLEVAREPRAGLRPRHPGDHDAALRAVHARHGGDQFDPPAAEVLVSPAARAAAPVVPGALAPAPRAPEHAPARAHADLEHGLGTQRRVDDARVLDHRVFDVEKLVEYPVHQALCGCLFILVENILPGKRSSLTPSTTQRRNPTHENSNSAIFSDSITAFSPMSHRKLLCYCILYAAIEIVRTTLDIVTDPSCISIHVTIIKHRFFRQHLKETILKNIFAFICRFVHSFKMTANL